MANGNCYFFNMCDVDINFNLNQSGYQPIAAIGPKPSFTPVAVPAPRTEQPQPWQLFAFGGSQTKSSNSVQWYLGDDITETRNVTLSLTLQELHIENDCQVYLFYDSAVLRWDGNSVTVRAVTMKGGAVQTGQETVVPRKKRQHAGKA